MSNYKNPFVPGGKFYNSRITDGSKVTEPRIMPRWAEQTEQQQNTIGTKFYDINTGEFIEQVEDNITQIISIEKTKYIEYSEKYSKNIFYTSIKGIFFTSYIVNASKNDVNFHILTGLTTEELNVRAFLVLIRRSENYYRDGSPELYNRKYSKNSINATFSDFSTHPGGEYDNDGVYHSPAGAYQFTESTWNSISKQANLSDFSPKNQDLGAIQLIKNFKAIENVKTGNFLNAINLLKSQWQPFEKGRVPDVWFKNIYKENIISELS